MKKQLNLIKLIIFFISLGISYQNYGMDNLTLPFEEEKGKSTLNNDIDEIKKDKERFDKTAIKIAENINLSEYEKIGKKFDQIKKFLTLSDSETKFNIIKDTIDRVNAFLSAISELSKLTLDNIKFNEVRSILIKIDFFDDDIKEQKTENAVSKAIKSIIFKELNLSKEIQEKLNDKNICPNFNALIFLLTKNIKKKDSPEYKYNKKVLKLFKYFLGKNELIKDNSIFKQFIKDLSNDKNLQEILGAIAFADLKETSESDFLSENQIRKIFKNVLEEVKDFIELQNLFNLIAKNLEFFKYKQVVTFFIKPTKSNLHKIDCLSLINEYCLKNRYQLDYKSIENIALLNFDHIVSLPSDTIHLEGLHIWKDPNQKLKRNVTIYDRGGKLELEVITELNKNLLLYALSKKEDNIISRLLIAQIENTSKKEVKKTKFKGNINLDLQQNKTSSFFPLEIAENEESILECLDMIFKSRNAFNESCKVMIGKYVYHPNGEKSKIYALLFLNRQKCLIPKVVTIFPIFGYNGVTEFTDMNGNPIKDKDGKILQIGITKEEDKIRSIRLKEEILQDIKKQIPNLQDPADLHALKPLNNKKVLQIAFNLNENEIDEIQNELQQVNNIKDEQTCYNLKTYQLFSQKFKDWNNVKLLETILFIFENLRQDSESILSYFVHNSKNKNDFKVLSIQCPCRIITTDKLSDYFDNKYIDMMKTLATAGLFIHINKSELL